MKSKIQQLRKWMVQKGCIIHPDVQIPSFVNGYQGVGTRSIIPPKTVVIAVPSSLILTVTKCYKDPLLKSIFTKNDDLFDYQASDDCEFNVLCVFLMYHKLNIETSPWKIYLQTIGEPQTAIDWPDRMLKGLNKSAIQQILHVRIECDKLRDQLSAYLKSTKQFSRYGLQQIKQCFNYCYRAVMTRCFGYYFGEASLIPVADLINHGCEVVDHQLINVGYEKNLQYCQDYKEKSDKIDCELLGIKRGKNTLPPFRERYLISNELVECDIQTLSQLDRNKIDTIIAKHNQTLFKQDQAIDITGLQFCEEDDSEDNDTDVDEQIQRELELERMHLEELEQIQNFKKYYDSVKVETYKEVQDRFDRYEKELEGKGEGSERDTMEETEVCAQSRNDLFIQGVKTGNIEQMQQNEHKQVVKEQTKQQNEQDWQDCDENPLNTTTTQKNQKNKSKDSSKLTQQQSTTSNFITPQNIDSLFFQQKPQPKKSSLTLQQGQRPITKATVPIQMIQSSQSQSEDDQQWGLLPDSYFTLSTSSAVGANKQLFNSYGSRTNKFLLIWYGFCYRNNLYDSVSLRLHVQFNKMLPKANSIVLDTYVGGQGRTFRKNESEVVKGNQVSRQFRLKMNKLCVKLLTFLRLYLLDYYKGEDLYKICVTLPSSIQYETFMLSYYKQIVMTLYDRYPVEVINELYSQLELTEMSQEDKQHIRFKLIFLQEQRKILDDNVDTVDCVIKVWERVKQRKVNRYNGNKDGTSNQNNGSDEFDKSFYDHFTIQQLRKLKPYLTTLKSNYSYVLYQRQQPQQQLLPTQSQTVNS